MGTHNVNKKKRKYALKHIMKEKIKASGSGVKFCYRLTIFLRALAVVLGIINIVHALIISKDLLELILVLITFGIPYGLSFMSAVVYIASTQSEYRFRGNEEVTIGDEGLTYSFHEQRAGMSNMVLKYQILYNQIDKIEFSDNTNLITLIGQIEVETYINGEFKRSITCKQVDFLDIYDTSVKDILVQNCK